MSNHVRACATALCAVLFASLGAAQKTAPRRPDAPKDPKPIQVLDENGRRLGLTITSFPVTTAVVGEMYDYQVEAEDNCSGAQIYTYALVEGPSGLALNGTSGLLSWIPQTSDVGFHDVRIRVLTSGGSLCPSSPRNDQRFSLEVVELPSEPEEEASPPDPNGSFFDETSFLWDGSSGIQTGVNPGTFDPELVSVLRGVVLDRDAGTPLSGVRLSVVGHPEFGETLSRADGMFDLAVNGGTALTLAYVRGGYLEAQRTADVPTNTYVCLDDVALVLLDENVTEVLLGQNEGVEVAMGSVETDAEGTRQATVVFPSGISAVLETDGGDVPILRINVRATEFSVGPNGEAALPGSLPPGMGYTYVVDLSADEGIAASADRVQFSDPVPLYVENFLDFDVGTSVSSAFYDPDLGVWVPAPDGLVIEIVGISAEGLALIDLDGDGIPEDDGVLNSTGIGEGERMSLGEMFGPDQELTRVEIDHFTAWTFALPVGATNLNASAHDERAPRFGDDNVPDAPTTGGGSILHYESQALGQRVPLVGTPFSLYYWSHRTLGWGVDRTISGMLTGSSVPSGMAAITLRVEVGGQIHIEQFGPTPDQGFSFTWDGMDAYGRPIQGGQKASVKIGYVYDGSYFEPLDVNQSFGVGGGIITTNPSRSPAVLAKDYRSNTALRGSALGSWDQRAVGLGGWAIGEHHHYDRERQTLFLGDGTRVSARTVIGAVIETIAGNGTVGFSGDGGPATDAAISGVVGIDVGPDGSVYFADFGNHRVRRVSPDGIITTVAGNGTAPAGPVGDGGPAVDAGIRRPIDVAVAKDGSLLVASFGQGRIRRVDENGIIDTIAGNGFFGSGPDGGPATESGIPDIIAVDVADDGSILIVELARTIRRVDTAGVIQTIAGSGVAVPGEGDGGPAIEAGFGSILGIDAAPDGSYLLALDSTFVFGGGNRIRRVTPTGRVETVAGTGNPGYNGDGGNALDALMDRPTGVAVTPELSFYVSEEDNNRVRFVDSTGTITTLAGTDDAGFSGDGGPAFRAELNAPTALALGPDGSIYVVDQGNSRIRRIRKVVPDSSLSDLFVPSPDGELLYRFDANGRHLSTLNAANGSVLLTFSYDTEGRLASILDDAGNTTTISHDLAGLPTAVTGPYGQTTTFGTDPNGYLETITNPDGDQHEFTYGTEGLMLTMDDPNGNPSVFAYDSLGRLMSDSDGAGGSQGFTRVETDSLTTVTRTTGLGRQTDYAFGVTGMEYVRLTVSADGTVAQEIERIDGTSLATLADGTQLELTRGPDPRFGMQTPVKESLVLTLPSNLSLTAQRSESVSLADPDDPTSLVSSTSTLVLNGRTHTDAWDVASSTLTRTSPAGRQVSFVLDAAGRVLTRSQAGLSDLEFFYDANGRLMQVAQGAGPTARVTTLVYDPTTGWLDTLTDPELGVTSYQHDPAGRVTQVSAPGPRVVGMAYDDNGNVQSVTPPGRPSHGFGYTGVDLQDLVSPPAIGLPTPQTAYAYNVDRQLELVTLPDGTLVDPTYDGLLGRQTSESTSTGSTTFGYDPATGQLTSIATAAGENLAYTYDGFLLSNVSWSGPVSGTVGRTYTSDLDLASHVVNGTTIAYSRDADGLLTGTGSLTLTRDAASGFVTATNLGATAESYGYDGFGEVTSYMAQAGASTVLAQTITRDRLGAITQVVETVGGVTDTIDYTYDFAGRLDTVSVNAVLISDYDYDANGNRTLHTIGGSTMVAGVYDDQDRLLSYGGVTYTYGDNGELSTRTDGLDVTTYTYDAYGSLVSVVLPDATVIGYTLDGNHRRVGRSVNSVLTQGFLYRDGLAPIAELNGSGTVVSLFYYGSKEHVPDYLLQGGVAYRLFTDTLGSVRQVVNTSTGAVVQEITYDEFGVVLSDTNPGFQPFGFAGGLTDPATNLVRFGARDYDPEVGRWTDKDPLSFAGGTNLYAYVGNNPTSFVDPTGLVRSAQGLEGAAQLAPGSAPGMLGILAARAGAGATSALPLAARNGHSAAHDLSTSWSGLLGESYHALLPGGAVENGGGVGFGTGARELAKWRRLAEQAGAPELLQLGATSPLRSRVQELLRGSDGISQTVGDALSPTVGNP